VLLKNTGKLDSVIELRHEPRFAQFIDGCCGYLINAVSIDVV
jgi:hypothetical protein